MAHSFSLPAALPMKKTVSFSDEYGMNHKFTVNDAVWDHVQAVVENQQGTGTTPVFNFGIYHCPSISSLPSTISQASYGSGGSQASASASAPPPPPPPPPPPLTSR